MTSKKPWSSTNPNNSEPKFHGTPIIEDKNGKVLRPITRGQQYLLEQIEQNDIIFVNGPPGCGKTAIATWYAIAAVDRSEFNHIILTRPILEAGENLGFLPGTIEEKVAPYMAPLYEFLSMVKGENPLTNPHKQEAKPFIPVSKYKKKKEGKYKGEYSETPIEKNTSNEDFYKKVNVCPLAYLRGSTKSKSVMILDEAENTTKKQLVLLLTRMGLGSKIIITGDIDQTDLERKSDSGFLYAQQVLKGVPGIAMVTLGIEDICRHKLVKDIILRFSKAQSSGYGKSEVYRHRPDEYDFTEDDSNIEDVPNIDQPNIDQDTNIYKEAPSVRKLPKKQIKKVVIHSEISDDKFDCDNEPNDTEPVLDDIESDPIIDDK